MMMKEEEKDITENNKKDIDKQQQPNNPVHGVKLLEMLKYLEKNMGWEAMADHIDIRCFSIDPSIGSSLTFLRRTPWAKDRVQQLYIQHVTNTLPKVKPRDTFVKIIEKKFLNKNK